MRTFLRGLTGLVVFFALWEAGDRAGLISADYIPPPSMVLTALVRLLSTHDFLLDLIATVLASAIVVVLTTVVAVPAGLLLGSVPLIRRMTVVIVDFLRPIPSVAMIPLAILIAGGGATAKISLACYAAVWPILFNTMYALDEIDPMLVDTARSFGLSRVRVLLRVSLPSAAPFVLTGIRLATAVALIVVLSTELLAGGSGGLGQYVLLAGAGGSHRDEVLAGTVLAGVIGYLANAGLERVHRRFFSWNTTEEAA